jgi:multidrug efflux pump subunit AcrA (membrane-fusion protein)
MVKNILKKIAKHKIISVIVLLIVVAGIYFSFSALSNKGTNTSYTLAEVSKGTIVSSVSGSGQIEAKDQADIKSEVSGDIESVNMTSGQSIAKGAVLATIDDSDAQETIQNAQKSLDSANLTLEKMQGMTTDEGFLRGEKEKAQTNLDKAYEDGFNEVSNSFLQLPTIISGLRDIIYSYTFSVSNGMSTIMET